jgi:hypothetical protein
MIEERRTESGSGEAVGRWSIRLRPDTPKTILDLFDFANATSRFATLVVTPARVESSAFSAATLRSLACYVGVLRTRSSEYEIGGVGVASLLGNEDGSCEQPTSPVTFAATVLSTALDSYLPTNGITKGSVTNTGTAITATLPAYASRRTLIQQIVDACGGEWRITTDSSGNLDVDAAVNATLYGSTPPAMVIETTGGRETTGIIGLEAVEIDQAHDVDDFATKQYVLARADGTVTIGSATSGASTSYFNGTAIKLEAVTDSSATDGTNANTVATLLLGQRQTLKRNIAVTVRAEDIVGKTWGPSGTSTTNVRCGDSIYIYDPLHGLVDTANQVSYRGQTLFPLKTRIYGLRWPVLGGMGVYLLTAASSPTIYDLSEWYEPETGSVTLDVGAQVRSAYSSIAQGASSPYGDMPTALVSDAYTTWTPTWTSSGTPSSVSAATGEWRRIGRMIHGSGEMTLNAVGTGTYYIALPVATVGTRQRTIGHGFLYLTGGATYEFTLRSRGSALASALCFLAATHGGAGGNYTQTFPIGAATGDYIEYQFCYEAETA